MNVNFMAIAALQGDLYAQVAQLSAENDALRAELATLRSQQGAPEPPAAPVI